MATKEEEIKRVKLKLELYGSYTKEFQQKEHRYFEIEQELNFNEDTRKAANNVGVHSNDPYHPASEKLQIEFLSLKQEMEDINIERAYLGLDLIIDALTNEEWRLINYIYVKDMTQIKGGNKAGMSRSTIRRKLNEIYDKFIES